MGKGDAYRPVDQDKYDLGYLKAFGLCRKFDCQSRWTCVRFLQTPSMDHKTWVPESAYDGTVGRCEYYTESKTKNPDEQELS